MSNIRRFIALAAIGMRGEIGGISFDQQAVERNGGYDLAPVGGVLVRDWAGDADVEAEAKGLLGSLEGTAE